MSGRPPSDAGGFRGLFVLAEVLALNAPFALAHPDQPLFTSLLLRSFFINMVLFVVPGWPWLAVLARRGWLKQPAFKPLWMIACSFATFVAVLAARYTLRLPPSPGVVWTMLWIVTNAAFAFSYVDARRQRASDRPNQTDSRAFLAVVLVAYTVFYFGATRVVPAVSDQDDEIQGTSYGLVTRLTPALRTTRLTGHLFAHPPMINIFVAGSMLFYNRIDDFARHDPRHPRALTIDEIDEQYQESPHLVETRTPNIFLGALTVALLAQWAWQISGAPWFGLLAGAAYLTMPDVFVRSAYGGYFTLSTLLLFLMLLAAGAWHERPDRHTRRHAMLAAALAAIADHKTMVLPGAVFVWSVLSAREWNMRTVFNALRHPLLVGFVIGYGAFWSYGFLISPHDFWMDHVRHHLVDRVLNNNARGLDMSAYPTLGALWLEFWRHTSYLLLPAGAAALALLCVSPLPAPEGEASGRGWQGIYGLWALWALVIAAAFSVIDWRQTKHLAPLIVPLIMAVARWGSEERRRPWIAVLLAVLVVLNLRTLASLAADFTSLPTVPGW